MASDRGMVLAADLTRLGVSPRDVRRAVDEGRLVRVARGVYAWRRQDRPLHPRELHAVRVRGVCALHPRNAVVSHISAAALHDLPLIGPWPGRVHLTVPGSTSGSASPGIFRHSPAIAPDEVDVDGIRVTSLARTLVDVAATSSMLVAVTMLDAALARRSTTTAALVDELERSGIRAGARRASASIDFADARAASPGESLTRVRHGSSALSCRNCRWASTRRSATSTSTSGGRAVPSSASSTAPSSTPESSSARGGPLSRWWSTRRSARTRSGQRRGGGSCGSSGRRHWSPRSSGPSCMPPGFLFVAATRVVAWISDRCVVPDARIRQQATQPRCRRRAWRDLAARWPKSASQHIPATARLAA